METTEIFKWLALISPIVSGILAGLLTHTLANRSKRLEFLYQHKIPAFKEMQKAILHFNRHISNYLIEQHGIDSVPEQVENLSTLQHTHAISDIFRVNQIYFNKKSRMAITKLINSMFFVSGLELQRTLNIPLAQNLEESYMDISRMLDDTVNILYKDLNLK